LLTNVGHMIYEDEENVGNVGMEFTPVTWDVGVNSLEVAVVLPEGVTKEEVRNTPDWNNAYYDPEEDNRLVLYWDGGYDPGIDPVLAGPDPGMWVMLSWPGPNDMFHDADYSYWWDPGEPAIRDVNLNGIYDVAVTFWAHLDNVSTNIIVCQKPIPPEYTGPWPEFPLGITLLLLIAPIIPLTYLWRLRKKVTKQ